MHSLTKQPPIHLLSFENPTTTGALGTTIGRRLANEDTHDIKLELSNHQPGVSFFGIYDGHGGKQASEFLKKNLSNRIANLRDIRDHEGIVKVFAETDEELINQEEVSEAGTCAVIALVERSGPSVQVKVCNVGDSRAILIPSDPTTPFIPLTNDHKPDIPEERMRIEAAGGFVSRFGGVARVNGSLAVSRAFGDRIFKNGDTPIGEKLVIAIPEIKEVTAKVGDYLLLACDGLFEPASCPSEWAAKLVSAQLRCTNNLGAIVKELISEALKAGSGDNITAMLVQFKNETETEEKNPVGIFPVLENSPEEKEEEETQSTASTQSDSESEDEGDYAVFPFRKNSRFLSTPKKEKLDSKFLNLNPPGESIPSRNKRKRDENPTPEKLGFTEPKFPVRETVVTTKDNKEDLCPTKGSVRPTEKEDNHQNQTDRGDLPSTKGSPPTPHKRPRITTPKQSENNNETQDKNKKQDNFFPYACGNVGEKKNITKTRL